VLTLIPVVLQMRKALKTEGSTWWVRVWKMTPVFVGFVIPVLLLWLAYAGLAGHRDRPASDASEGNQDEKKKNDTE